MISTRTRTSSLLTDATPPACPRRKPIHIIGVPMDLGSGRRGVDMGPSAIRIAGLGERTPRLGHSVIDEGDFGIRNIEDAPESGIRMPGTWPKSPAPTACSGRPRCCGSCAAAISRWSWAGITRSPLGRSRVSRPTRALGRRRSVSYGWMPTATSILRGHLPPEMSMVCRSPRCSGSAPRLWRRIGGRFRKVDPGNVALVGIRSVDEGERRHLRQLGVHVYTMADIDRHGIHTVMEKALANVTQGRDYVHVSFDLDAVDPSLAPGVGTPVKGGLDYREAHLVMESLSFSRRHDVAGTGRGQSDSRRSQ